jgi:hypothetical protein
MVAGVAMFVWASIHETPPVIVAPTAGGAAVLATARF